MLKRFLIILALYFSFESSIALGQLSFGVSGSGSDNNLGLETWTSNAVSATVAVDLGTFLRLGYTHRQKYDTKNGYKKDSSECESSCSYSEFKEKSFSTTDSIDLTILLYRGELFVPFIFGGVARKTYESEYTESGETIKSEPYVLPAVPNGGAGVSLIMNKNFSLKVSRTWSPGVIQDPATGETRKALDSYTQLGITYRF